MAVAGQPTGGERLVADHPAAFDPYGRHAVADRRAAIPRAMLRDEDSAAILRRKHHARVKAHAERRDVRPELRGRRREVRARLVASELRVRDRAAVTVWKAEMQPRLRRVVQLVRRAVVTQPIAAVVGEPQLVGSRLPIEAHAVANAAREDFDRATVRLHPCDRLVQGPGRQADIARCTDRDIEPTVGTERDELPPVMAVARVAVGDDDRRPWTVQPRLDVVEAEDPSDLGDVQRAIAERDAVRAGESGPDLARLGGA